MHTHGAFFYLSVMSITSEQQTEINKLQHLLAEDGTASLIFLQKLSFEELQTLRQRIQSAIYMEQSSQWKRLAGVAKFMPNFANAKVAEQALGPSITANMSYFIDVRDAVSIMKFLSIPFMAEVASFMIPDKCTELINKLPMDTMKKLVSYLIKQQKHFVVGSFVEVTELNRVIEIARFVDKEEDLVGITKFVQHKDSLAGVFRVFPESKKLRLIEVCKQEGVLSIVVEMSMHLQTGELISMANMLANKRPALLLSLVEEMVRLNQDGKYNYLINSLKG
jgi:hypothetical protein